MKSNEAEKYLRSFGDINTFNNDQIKTIKNSLKYRTLLLSDAVNNFSVTVEEAFVNMLRLL